MYSWQFSKKISPPQKWRPFWIFESLPKMEKHKFASISLTVWDRAISSKFSTHRVSEQCSLGSFQKTFPPQKWQPFCIFKFLQKMEKHKFASISLTVRDRTISSKFSTPVYLNNVLLAIFKKISPPQKWRTFWIFAKNGKTRFTSISLTVWDKAISSKFSTHRVSKECTLGNFQKKFPPSQKWRPFWIFKFLLKMEKHKFVSISLTMWDRVIWTDFVEIFNPQGI